MNHTDPTGMQDMSSYYRGWELVAADQGKSLPEFAEEMDRKSGAVEIGLSLLPVEAVVTRAASWAARALGIERLASRTVSFASTALRDSHFAKHSAEFGFKSASAYERAAGNFMGGKAGRGVLEGTRKSGDVVRFNPKTNEFGVLSKDGNVRTYFKPDPAQHGLKDNMEYFKRALQ